MGSSDDVLDRTTELRHVSNKYLLQLSTILNNLDAWKRLMAAIPYKQISATEFDESQLKYKSSEIKIIELGSRDMKQQPMILLFEEWGTSGYIRPNVGHLLNLLTRLNLFRAADFVAVEMLKENLTARPQTGPAANVDISLYLKQGLDGESVVEDTIANQNQPEKQSPAVDKQIPKSDSNLIQFSSNIGRNTVQTSAHERRLESRSSIVYNQEVSACNLPQVSILQQTSRTQADPQNQIASSINIPHFSVLISNNQNSNMSANIPAFTNLLETNEHPPKKLSSNLSLTLSWDSSTSSLDSNQNSINDHISPISSARLDEPKFVSNRTVSQSRDSSDDSCFSSMGSSGNIPMVVGSWGDSSRNHILLDAGNSMNISNDANKTEINNGSQSSGELSMDHSLASVNLPCLSALGPVV